MKKIFTILILVTIMCWGTSALATTIIDIVSSGISLIQDETGDSDLLLVNCDESTCYAKCSLPGGADGTTPPWTDIKMVKVQQVWGNWVEFMIITNGYIPKTPEFYVSFTFAFNYDPPDNWKNNSGIRIAWSQGEWSAAWFKIDSLTPKRQASTLDEISNFIIYRNTVIVRVSIEELDNNVNDFVNSDSFYFSAYIRRTPFVTESNCKTEPVDAMLGLPEQDIQAFFRLR